MLWSGEERYENAIPTLWFKLMKANNLAMLMHGNPIAVDRARDGLARLRVSQLIYNHIYRQKMPCSPEHGKTTAKVQVGT